MINEPINNYNLKSKFIKKKLNERHSIADTNNFKVDEQYSYNAVAKLPP